MGVEREKTAVLFNLDNAHFLCPIIISCATASNFIQIERALKEAETVILYFTGVSLKTVRSQR